MRQNNRGGSKLGDVVGRELNKIGKTIPDAPFYPKTININDVNISLGEDETIFRVYIKCRLPFSKSNNEVRNWLKPHMFARIMFSHINSVNKLLGIGIDGKLLSKETRIRVFYVSPEFEESGVRVRFIQVNFVYKKELKGLLNVYRNILTYRPNFIRSKDDIFSSQPEEEKIKNAITGDMSRIAPKKVKARVKTKVEVEDDILDGVLIDTDQELELDEEVATG